MWRGQCLITCGDGATFGLVPWDAHAVKRLIRNIPHECCIQHVAFYTHFISYYVCLVTLCISLPLNWVSQSESIAIYWIMQKMMKNILFSLNIYEKRQCIYLSHKVAMLHLKTLTESCCDWYMKLFDILLFQYWKNFPIWFLCWFHEHGVFKAKSLLLKVKTFKYQSKHDSVKVSIVSIV